MGNVKLSMEVRARGKFYNPSSQRIFTFQREEITNHFLLLPIFKNVAEAFKQVPSIYYKLNDDDDDE